MSELNILKEKVDSLTFELANKNAELIAIKNELVNLENKQIGYNARILALTNASPNSLIEINENFTFKFLNNEGKKLFQISDENYIGKTIENYIDKTVAIDIISNVKTVLATKSDITSVFLLRDKYFKIIGRLNDNNSEPTVILNATDVTDQINYENEIKRQSVLLQKVFDESSDCLVVYDLNTNKIINCNRTTFKLFEIDEISTLEQVGNFIENARIFKHSYDNNERIRKALKEKGKYESEFEYVSKGGKHFIASYKANIIDVNKNTIVLTKIEDITEAKRTNQKNHIDKQKQKLHIEQSPLGYIEWNSNLEVIEWNQAATAIFGYAREEVMGKNASFLMQPLERENVEIYWQGVLENEKGSRDILTNLTKNENTVHIAWYNTPLYDEKGKLLGISSLIDNITEKVKAEEALKGQAIFLNTIYEEAFDGIVLFEPYTSNVITSNKRALEIFEVEDIAELKELMHNTRKIKFSTEEWANLYKELENGQIHEKETEFITKKGNSIWVTTFFKILEFNNETVELARFTDVSALKISNTKLNLESQKQKIHFEQSHLGYIEWNLNFEVAEWNPVAEKIFGYKKEEALGMHAQKILPDNEKNNASHIWNKMLAYKKGNREVYNNSTKNGDLIKLEWFDTPLYDEDGQVLGVSSLVNDVTEKLKSEEELKYKSDFLETIYDEAYDGILLFKKFSYQIVSCNKRALEIFECSSIDELNTHFPIARKIKQSPQERMQIFNDISNGAIYNKDIEFTTCKGNSVWLSLVAKLITLNENAIELIRVTDVTELKKLNAKLNLDRQKQLLHVQHSPLGYIEWNENFEVLEWNKSAANIFGYSKEEAVGKHASFIVPETAKPLVENIWKQLKGKKGGYKSANQNITKNNKLITIEWYNTPLTNEEGEFIGVSSLIDDITEQINSKSEIERQLKEKEILLSEIHHRVKNNLAIISGLLFLHSETSNDESIKLILKESQSRIKSIAIIHEQLYETENFGNINVNKYINDLVNKISNAFNIGSKRIKLEINIDNFTLPISKALIIGLIINELIINSYKYAFDSAEVGKIKIRFEKKNKYYLTVSDNGKGFNENYNHEKTSTLGLNLVKILAKQLNGDILFENKKGAYCTLIFSKL